MKSKLLLLFSLLSFYYFAHSQCTLGTPYFATTFDASTLVEGMHTEIACCMWGNEYIPINNIVAGNVYTFDICGVSYDSEITLFDPNNDAVVFDTSSCGDDGLISSFVPALNGTYKLQVNAAFCAGHANNTPAYITLDATLSLLPVDLIDVQIKIYPNPISNAFSIQTNQVIEQLFIYNVNGKVVKIFKKNKAPYNIEELTSGLYFIKIVNAKNSITKKIIKK